MATRGSESGSGTGGNPELAIQSVGRAIARFGRSHPLVRAIALHPVVARPGYWLATACGLLWGGVLSLGRIRHQGGVILARAMPRWSFGRGGTTIGAVYLTHDKITAPVLQHESVHRAQWKHYGLAFIPLYLEAGPNPHTNRFEVQAGLKAGGYE